MIQLMVYLLVIATLFGVAASISERLCERFELPRRSVWIIALLASTLLPAYSVLTGGDSSPGTPILSLPELQAAAPIAAFAERIGPYVSGAPRRSSFSWPEWQIVNSALLAVWLMSSLALLTWLGLGFIRMRNIVAQAQTRSIGGQAVLVSGSVGPAVVGFVRPCIVFPIWLAMQGTATTSSVLVHEQEHIAARDPLLLLAAVFIVAAMPWNIALWWQLGRLRCAIEIDCDRRVIAQGADPREYSRALLSIGKQSRGVSSPTSLVAVALSEPKLELEKRISIMMNRLPRLGLTAIGTRSVLVTSLLGLTVAVNAPRAQQPVDSISAPDWNAISAAQRPEVSALLREADECLSADDMDCVHGNLDKLNAIPDLSLLEIVGVKQFEANVGHVIDDPELSIGAYQAIIALPSDGAYASLARGATRNLAILYLQNERADEGIAMYNRFLAWPGSTSAAMDYYLLAAALYHADRFEDAIDPLLRAIALSTVPNKQYFSVLYVLQSELGDDAGRLDTLEKLNAYWPDDNFGSQAALLNPESALERLRTTNRYLPVNSIQPEYPEAALIQRLEGFVLVKYTVATDGSTKDVEVLESSSEIFDEAAIDVASRYLYPPRMIDGTPVEVAGVTTRIEFALPAGV